MTSITSTDLVEPSHKPNLNKPMGLKSILIYMAIVALGLFFTAYSIYADISATGAQVTTILPFLLLGVALFIAWALNSSTASMTRPMPSRR